MFEGSGTEPEPHGNFATISKPYLTDLVDTVVLPLTNPEIACCSNTMGVDILVMRFPP